MMITNHNFLLCDQCRYSGQRLIFVLQRAYSKDHRHGRTTRHNRHRIQPASNLGATSRSTSNSGNRASPKKTVTQHLVRHLCTEDLTHKTTTQPMYTLLSFETREQDRVECQLNAKGGLT